MELIWILIGYDIATDEFAEVYKLEGVGSADVKRTLDVEEGEEMTFGSYPIDTPKLISWMETELNTTLRVAKVAFFRSPVDG